MTRPLKVGDRVTATGTVKRVTPKEIAVHFDGVRKEYSNYFYRVDEQALTLLTPAEPPVGSVVVKDGVAWKRHRNAWCSSEIYGRYWSELADGDVIFQPEGDGQ